MKDYNAWNQEKITTQNRSSPIPYFAEGDIWWIKLGLNIGIETDGKGEKFARPVLIIKKYNQYSLLCSPLSTQVDKNNKYRIMIGRFNNKDSTINLSQLKTIDSKRLLKKIGRVNHQLLAKVIKRKTSEVNFN